MTKYYVNAIGDYLGGFDGAPPPKSAIEVPNAPSDAAQKWDGAKWLAKALTKDEQNAIVLKKLAEIDNKKIRALSDAVLTNEKSLLITLENEAAAERLKLVV